MRNDLEKLDQTTLRNLLNKCAAYVNGNSYNMDIAIINVDGTTTIFDDPEAQHGTWFPCRDVYEQSKRSDSSE